jgi:hypothetical protein
MEVSARGRGVVERIAEVAPALERAAWRIWAGRTQGRRVMSVVGIAGSRWSRAERGRTSRGEYPLPRPVLPYLCVRAARWRAMRVRRAPADVARRELAAILHMIARAALDAERVARARKSRPSGG